MSLQDGRVRIVETTLMIANTPAKPLRRPIICICNDLYVHVEPSSRLTHRYATALRPLRPFARVIRFRKPQAQFLVKRLREICDRETLVADMRVLTALVEVTTGDVRSCLNTLQVGLLRTFPQIKD